jgi:hypothetical protein
LPYLKALPQSFDERTHKQIEALTAQHEQEQLYAEIGRLTTQLRWTVDCGCQEALPYRILNPTFDRSAGNGGAKLSHPPSNPFASGQSFSGDQDPVDSDDLSDSVGRVGGAGTGTDTGILLASTVTTQVRHIWLPPTQDGKTTFVGKRKHLDSQFERKSLDFMLTAPASKWLHADLVEIDNQVFLSDLEAGLWSKVSGLGFPVRAGGLL